MRIQAIIPAFIALCLLATPLLAEPKTPLRFLGPQCEQTPVYHVLGGQKLQVEIALDLPASAAVEIQADLFQKAQSLLAPVKKEIAVAQITPPAPSEGFLPLVTWTLSIPEVQRETQFLARLKTKTKGSEWLPAGQIIVMAYPVGFAQEDLARFAKDPGLAVFGSESLRQFFDVQKISYEDAGSDLESLPANPTSNAIYLGEATSRQCSKWLTGHPDWPGKLVVFCTDSPLLPGVFATSQNGARTVKVTLPLLDTLSSDLRSQKTLLEILKSITAL